MSFSIGICHRHTQIYTSRVSPGISHLRADNAAGEEKAFDRATSHSIPLSLSIFHIAAMPHDDFFGH
jgi:hypothetical protein